MSGNRCLLSSSRALSRAFQSPTSTSEVPRFLVPWSSYKLQKTARSRPNTSFQTRCLSHTPFLSGREADEISAAQARFEQEEQIDRRFTLSNYMERTGRDRLPWDHEITDPQIMVLDAGSVEGPISTRFVLTKLESYESLRMIQPYTPANPKTNKKAEYALCKIVDKNEEYKLAKQRKEQKKKDVKPKTKVLEISWGISDHDFQTKFRQIGGFLEKGSKVELTLGKKKGAKKVADADAEALLKKVRQEIEAREAHEVKPAQGQVGGTLRMTVERKGGKKKE